MVRTKEYFFSFTGSTACTDTGSGATVNGRYCGRQFLLNGGTSFVCGMDIRQTDVKYVPFACILGHLSNNPLLHLHKNQFQFLNFASIEF